MSSARLISTRIALGCLSSWLCDRVAWAQPASSASPAASVVQASPTAGLNVLQPFRVFGERDADPFVPMPRLGFRLPPIEREPHTINYESAPFLATVARAPQSPPDVAPTAYVLLAEPLRAVVGVTLDGALSGTAGVGLIKRETSLADGPLQPVALRGLGFAGGGGALVLLDGIPLNDPFSGGVAWTQAPRDGLARVEAVPAGGANVWGNGALVGVVQLFTRRARGETIFVRLPPPLGSPPYTEGKVVMGERATLLARAEVGDYGTRSLEWAAVYPSEIGYWQLLGRVFGTDGFHAVAPEYRGAVDLAAWQRHREVTFHWKESFGTHLELGATVRGFEESRGLGTPYERSGRRERLAAGNAQGQVGLKFRWQATAYAQDQSSARRESVVNAARTAETPVRDQFAVPAKALGAAWIGTWKHAGQSATISDRSSVGADLTHTWGEARENFQWNGADFAGQRFAGGAQSAVGVFGLHERDLGEGWRALAGARLDWLRDSDGHRWEIDRGSGAILRNDRSAAERDRRVSPSAGLVWAPNRSWRARANVQQAFRRPTLDELFHPGRDGPDEIETSADLRPELSTSAEVGVEWTFFALRSAAPTPAPAKPRPPVSTAVSPRGITFSQGAFSKDRSPVSTAVLTVGATGFHHEISDLVGGVAAARGTGLNPRFDLIGTGGVGRQRMNLELARVHGLELFARWMPWRELTLTGSAAWQDAEVCRAPAAPSLVGKGLRQVPRQFALLSATWQAPATLRVMPRIRYLGRQYTDEENLRPLGRAAVVDLAVSRALNKNVELYLSVENLGNARLETGRSGAEVVRIGAPRLAVGGLRGSW